MNTDHPAERSIVTYAETDLVATIERLAGRPLAELTRQQRDLFDQFHVGGPEAVERLLPGLQLTAGTTVLDVGAGFGGPARQVAATTGAHVVGVDLTAAYVEAARALTDAAGLGDRVRFECTDVAALAAPAFDAAYTMHVQMNVADKLGFFTAIAGHLRPGARFACFEVCRTGPGEPSLPLPWSLDGSDSFLVTADELRATIEASGFEALEWVDETAWVREWFERAGARVLGDGTQATLPALLADGATRMVNFAGAIMGGVVAIYRGTFVRAG